MLMWTVLYDPAFGNLSKFTNHLIAKAINPCCTYKLNPRLLLPANVALIFHNYIQLNNCGIVHLTLELFRSLASVYDLLGQLAFYEIFHSPAPH